MSQPITEIARGLNSQCQVLSDSLKALESGGSVSRTDEKISKSIQTFFESIQQLPNKVSSSENGITVLFEIDRSLCGTYGSRVFGATEATTPTRKLLRDLSALWQRYYLIAGLARTDATNASIPGTMSFYEEWLKTEQVGTEESEYDRILANLSFMLRDTKDLNVPTKIVLFSLMGKIAMTLGVSDDFARSKLQSHTEDIMGRKIDLSTNILAEILLCLQVLWMAGKSIEAGGVQEASVRKAIRYWGSMDDFLASLFKEWGWVWENDYVSQLAMGDQIFLKERSNLFLSWANGTAKLGVGHSFLELNEHKRKSASLMTIFQPIPIFMFGQSGVGKSNYLTAFCYDVQMHVGKSLTFDKDKPLTLGRELQAYYENTADAWRGGTLAPTAGSSSYNFWSDLNVTSFSMIDYGGKDTQPDQWERQLQEEFRNSKGLLFFIGEEDYRDPAKLKRRANWFDAILQYWMQGNPGIKHVPIGLILTKCDILLHESIQELKRSSLVPSLFQPALIETYLPQRIQKGGEGVRTSYGRMRDFLLSDRANNIHPVLQDIVQTLLDNFAQFFNRVLDLTYNYQVFVTSASPPREPNDPVFPWGVKDPIVWIANILEKFHLRESLLKFKGEENQIDSEIKVLREDMAQMQRYRDEIATANAEISRLRQKSTLFQVTMKDRIKFHEENKQKTEQDFMAILQRYVKDPAEMNKVAGFQAVEREVRKKEELLSSLREKRNDFENRLKTN